MLVMQRMLSVATLRLVLDTQHHSRRTQQLALATKLLPGLHKRHCYYHTLGLPTYIRKLTEHLCLVLQAAELCVWGRL